MKNKKTLAVGDLVKPVWASATSANKEDIKYYIPPMGIITKITYNEVHKQYIAEIDWQETNVPELKAATSNFELNRFNKYYNQISTNNLTLYEPYIKSFTARNKRKLYKK